MEMLDFRSTEILKAFSPLFKPDLAPTVRDNQITQLARRFDFVVLCLFVWLFFLGVLFTIADAYLFTVMNWCQHFNIDLARWPKIRDYLARIEERPSVQAARKMEASQ